MAIYIYRVVADADGPAGSLFSYAPNDDDPVADDATLAAQGRAKIAGLPPLAWDNEWSPANLTTQRPASRVMAPVDFVGRFTGDELAALAAAVQTDTQVLQYKAMFDALKSEIDLMDPRVEQAMNYITGIKGPIAIVSPDRINNLLGA